MTVRSNTSHIIVDPIYDVRCPGIQLVGQRRWWAKVVVDTCADKTDVDGPTPDSDPTSRWTGRSESHGPKHPWVIASAKPNLRRYALLRMHC